MTPAQFVATHGPAELRRVQRTQFTYWVVMVVAFLAILAAALSIWGTASWNDDATVAVSASAGLWLLYLVAGVFKWPTSRVP